MKRGTTEPELERLLHEYESGSLGKKTRLTAAVTCPIGCAIALFAVVCACSEVLLNPPIIILMVVAGLILPFVLNRDIPNDHQKRALRSLASIDDPRVLPPMIEVSTWPQQDLRSVARLAVVRLLPTVTEADANLFSTRHRSILRDKLRAYVFDSDPDDTLARAILLALERIGTQADVPAVSLIANRPNIVLRDKSTLEQAVRLIPLLNSRAQGPDTLLRPADSVPEAVLLRPAGDSGSDPAALLRPSDETDKESRDT